MKQEKLKFLEKELSLIVVLLVWSLCMHAQGGISVKGAVVDAKGESVIGATVTVKGKSGSGTVTDFDGHFVLTVPSESSVLMVTYVGMKPKEVRVGGQRSFKVTLEEDNA